MRWYLAEYGTAEEQKNKREKLRLIEAFWAQFERDHKTLREAYYQRASDFMLRWLVKYLQAIDENLMWEIGKDIISEEDRLILAITPEENHHLRPMTNSIIELAPQIPAWRFTQHKTPVALNVKNSKHSMAKQNWDDLEAAIIAKETNAFDLVFRSQFIKSRDKYSDLQEVFLAADTFLGQEYIDIWIDIISTVPKDEGLLAKVFALAKKEEERHEFFHLDEVRTRLSGMIADLIDNLPDYPVLDIESKDYSVMKLSAEHHGRISSSTKAPNVIMAKLSRNLFHSSNFSKHGEVFAYIKTSLSPFDSESVEWVYAVEEAIDANLRKERVGASLGTGFGPGMGFIDLALLDVHASLKIIRQELNRAEASKHTWMLFYDTYMRDEWWGLGEDTPPPPRQPESGY